MGGQPVAHRRRKRAQCGRCRRRPLTSAPCSTSRRTLTRSVTAHISAVAPAGGPGVDVRAPVNQELHRAGQSDRCRVNQRRGAAPLFPGIDVGSGTGSSASSAASSPLRMAPCHVGGGLLAVWRRERRRVQAWRQTKRDADLTFIKALRRLSPRPKIAILLRRRRSSPTEPFRAEYAFRARNGVTSNWSSGSRQGACRAAIAEKWRRDGNGRPACGRISPRRRARSERLPGEVLARAPAALSSRHARVGVPGDAHSRQGCSSRAFVRRGASSSASPGAGPW